MAGSMNGANAATTGGISGGATNVTPRKAAAAAAAATAATTICSTVSAALEQESPLVLDDDLRRNNSNSNTNTNTNNSGAGVGMTARRNNNNNNNNNRKINFAYTIVWSPLPPITWLIPFIGHTGICDSSGVASDFQGPYYVGDDGRMAFGAPTRYLKILESTNTTGSTIDSPVDMVSASSMDATITTSLSGSGISSSNYHHHHHNAVTAERWDTAIQHANDVYRGRMHNICCDNCHSHVAYALNDLSIRAYGVVDRWDMVKLATVVFFRASFVSYGAVAVQFLPLTVLVVAWIWYLRS